MATISPPIDFSSALASYKTLSLPSLQSHLQSLTSPLTSIQISSLTARKHLAEQTREFKKLPEESKLESYKPLLKLYQAEIDDLTKRSREAENGVRIVEERLRGVVDPVLVLEGVIDQFASLTELESIKEQNEQLIRERDSLKTTLESQNHLETDRNQLSERLASLEASFEKQLTETKASVEAEVTARFDERLSNATSREAELTRSLELAQEQLKQLRTSHDNTTERLLSSSQASSSREQTSEYDMLASDLQRANERVATVEKRNEQLREEVERVKSGRVEGEKIHQLEERVREVDEERARLQNIVDGQEEKRRGAVEEMQKKIGQLEVAVKDRSAEIASVRAKLDAQADYEELKRELEIIRIVEFSGGLDDEDDDAVTPSKAKPLEALLLEKNKRLQDDLATLRIQVNEVTQSSSTSSRELESLRSEVTRLTKLNERLESDLLEIGPSTGKSNGTSAPSRTAAAGMSAEEALAEMDRIEQGATAVPKSAPASTPAARASTSTPDSPANLPAQPQDPASSSSSSSLLPIIISQRDRFRTRNAELEEELRKQFQVITTLRTEVKTLQTDNLSLYEKVRYLQSYGGSSSSSGSRPIAAAARDAYPPGADQNGGGSRHTKVPIDLASGSGGEDKYREKYEQSVHPFEAFRGREQRRALSSLNPLERLLHMMTQLVLSDRRMRILIVLYLIGMHLFVFGLVVDYTFYGGSGDSCGVAGMDPAVSS